ncbi:MAG: peptidoglycan editing factor PgeF [Candidatus Shapirobacteria bacterium]|nr:peptidoglycan editing factor PgeF [Candidatus Shapirobacteria bacterium]MDD5073970.1 peptidoglycan editing factor PgeF [Candidatus Shapirobacteria bacterium]MDD5481678.1 peptidoglycan editing factor PgeF [Candidatus Shapirobacteria bacterium]
MIGRLDLFCQEKNLSHGFASKAYGNFSLKNNGDNFRLLAKDLNLLNYPLIQAEQIHSDNIALIKNNDQPLKPKVDGLITKEFGLVLAIRTADCLPIIYYERKKKIIGAVHAGWRGLLKNLPGKMVQYIKQQGGQTDNIIVGIGPHVGSCCYQVGEELPKLFIKKQPNLKNFSLKQNNKHYLNLLTICQQQLEKEGIKKTNLARFPACTACQNQHWWSYRQEGKSCGSMLTVICQKDD